MGAGTHANCATDALGGAPCGATNCVRTHAKCATDALGGAPYGATKRVRGVPKWVRVTMTMTMTMMCFPNARWGTVQMCMRRGATTASATRHPWPPLTVVRQIARPQCCENTAR